LTHEATTARGHRAPRPRLSLLRRVFLTNATVLVVATALLALTPATISSPVSVEELSVLLAGVAALLIVNLVLIRRTFAPLNRVRELMGRFDPLQPGPRLPVEGLDSEILDLTTAFNDMAERLELERRQSAGRALAAQERERHRLAQELHDEIGQSLTGLLLLLESAARTASDDVRDRLQEARQAARSGLEDLRRIVQELRPEALDELGLQSALAALCDRVSEQSGMRVVRELEPEVPPLDEDRELVLYRVAQESLTNVVRHASATCAELRLESLPGAVRLQVTDNGRGLNGPDVAGSSGIRGMRERALLVNGNLSIRSGSPTGVEVTLDVPLGPNGAP
jgi:two-component system sensor histidine kinase UhpB